METNDNRSYGIFGFEYSQNEKVKKHIQNLSQLGFSIEENFLTTANVDLLRNRLDTIYKIQENTIGKDYLASIKDLDMCRAPLLYDNTFLDLATDSFILEIVENAIQNKVVLHLQNGIINRPQTTHHQQSWHRDLPYQNFVSSKPLSISALVTLDPFTKETGATQVLMGTHKTEINTLDDLNTFQIVDAEAQAGSIIFFDSMLYHRAGVNTSNIVRRGINHMYTTPILKQQYDFPKSSDQKVLSEKQKKVLGFDFQIPKDDIAWRRSRKVKTQK